MQNSVNSRLGSPVASLDVESRATFIMRTYYHLFGAIAAFTLVEIMLFKTGIAFDIMDFAMGTSWLLMLGGFMIVGVLASRIASRAQSLPAQYAALAGYVIAEAILFVPLLFIAQMKAPGVIQSAALITLIGAGALTAIVFTTRKDFSFLNGILRWGFIVALLAIVGAMVFGFQLGTFFSVAMIGLAGAAILRDTSNILLNYPEDRYVGASLQLFASIALMFWYVLRLLSRR